MVNLEQLCREVWGAYEYLRENDLSAESGTSKRLRAADLTKLKARLLEELMELRGVVEGTHHHEGFDQDIILEGYEVWYWAVCLAIASQIGYDELQPHKALSEGFKAVPAGREALLPAFDTLVEKIGKTTQAEEVKDNFRSVFRLIGQACSLNRTLPARLLERDRDEMRQKEYLAPYWQLVNNR
ncbi:MAG TPA: hypothetical protein VH186_29160 [Chloroflexia bacterium]|nr:hypothetical protein [Chloroflexia bacterium]